MIAGLKGANPLCNLGILENAAFIKLSEGDAFSLGCGAWGGLEGAVRGIFAEPARARAVEAANFGALGDAWAASAGAGATFPKSAQKLGNLTGYSRISYQVNIQIGWDGLADRLSSRWKGVLGMANGHGGASPGSGRPRKALAQKILEGHPDKRKPKVLDIKPGEHTTVPIYPERLAYYPARFQGEPTSQDIWNETVAFLETTGCLHMIKPLLIEQYSLLLAKFFEAERIISKAVLVYDDEKRDNIREHPAVDVSHKYLRMAQMVWDKIWAIVQQNSEKSYNSNSHDDLMSGLLRFNRNSNG